MEKTLIAALKGRLIVQCQAPKDSPLHGPLFMSAMAAAAEQAGAGWNRPAWADPAAPSSAGPAGGTLRLIA